MATSDTPSDSEKTAGGKTDPLPATPSPNEGAAKPAPQAEAQGFEDAIKHLRILKNLTLRQIQNSAILDNFYVRSIETVEARLLLLSEMPLPIPRKPRQIIRNMQDLLELLAKLLLTPAEEKDAAAPAAGIPSLALWRVLHLLSRHLLISSLIAAPPGAGIWKQLHEAYQLAMRLDITRIVPEGATRSLREEYYAAILLGCAQPTSFTGREVYYLDTYLERFSQHVDTDIDALEGGPVTFWINPENDGPATPYSRKHPRPETPVVNFSCRSLTTLLESQLAALEAGTPPKQLNLSSFAGTAGGIGVMNRLIHLWGNPGKRRFPRRSQNYRGDLCIGFNNLCNLYKPEQQPVVTSAWMITNESPDGYTVMHLSGRTRRAIAVGDVAALRTKTGGSWQLCIIRWALSENQEHMELGLQVLAPCAYTANIALPGGGGKEAKTRFRPTLVLPTAPTLRENEALIVHSGALGGRSKNLVLIIERENVEIREIDSIRCDERNSLIELY
ncbi:MAG: hypothetical protein LBI59_12355, partial [Candidatus Accumulibacter sp.]|nr:hypothetical protein [Accumulibacter sp.]